MIKDCLECEAKIQELLDFRIDPETDQAVGEHTSNCQTCHENLIAYSLLHTSYLNDSDSLKLKLENLSWCDANHRKRSQSWNRKSMIAIVASVAAIFLLAATLNFRPPKNDRFQPVAVLAPNPSTPSIDVARQAEAQIQSLARIKHSLDRNEIYQSLSGLPGIRPFKTLANCLDWFGQSLVSPTQFPSESPLNDGDGGEVNPSDDFFNSQFTAFPQRRRC